MQPIRTSKDLKNFLLFPWKIQEKDPNWIPPLLIDQKGLFNKKSHPFYEHGEVESWLARSLKNGEIVGRISAIVNHAHNDFAKDKVGFFGFFECIDDQEVARALLNEASLYLRKKGMTSIRGPMNFSTNEECGMLIDGFDTPPAVMMTHNPPYYNTLVEKCGFQKTKDLLAYQLSVDKLTDRVLRVGEKMEQRTKLKIRNFNRKDFKNEIDKFLKVYTQAWESNWGFVPMTDKEVNYMAKNLKMVLDERLIFFAENEKGEPVGFSMALPDLNVIIKQINGRLFPTGIFKLLTGLKKLTRCRVLVMGVVKEYRMRGIDAIFYYRSYKSAMEAGYKWGEFSWILEDNTLMRQAAENMGADAYKTWRIWEKQL